MSDKSKFCQTCVAFTHDANRQYPPRWHVTEVVDLAKSFTGEQREEFSCGYHLVRTINYFADAGMTCTVERIRR